MLSAHRYRSARARAAIALIAVVAVLVPTFSAQAATPADSADLRQAVTAEAIMVHQQALQAIADANDDTRASAPPAMTPRSTM